MCLWNFTSSLLLSTLKFLGVQCSFILIWQVYFLDFGVAVPSSASFRVVGGTRLTVLKSLRHCGVFVMAFISNVEL